MRRWQWRRQDFRLGERTLPSPFSPLSFPFLSSPLTLSFSPLEVGFPIPAREVWGSAVSSPSGVWGGAPAEIEFGAFSPQNMTSGGNNFK